MASLYSFVAARKPCRTQFVEHAVDEKKASEWYLSLRDNTQWEIGIRSRGKHLTRLQKAVNYESHPKLFELAGKILSSRFRREPYIIDGGYLNYYRDGEMFTPNHNHPGTNQLVLSFGATRTLKVGSKDYKMSNGSAILFGSGIHGVPKEPTVKEGRISFAIFCLPG